MSFSQDNGYVPNTVNEIMEVVRTGINTQFGTSYTTETFLGTNWYKYFYALVQRLQLEETKTSEIFLKLQQYISFTNERIQRPSVSFEGLVESFKSKGYSVSVKPMLLADAGTISIAVDVDETAPDYPDVKLEVATLIKDFVAAGLVSIGSEVENITISNGQNFDFKFDLPIKTPILLRLTCTISDNNLIEIPDDIEIRQNLFERISALYRMGLDFEPERYWNTTDAPWASEILLEYSDDDGVTYEDGIFQAGYRDLLTYGLEDIEIIIV
jgi:hypothetical protein